MRDGLGADAVAPASLDAILAIELPEAAAKHRQQFCAMMDDDFNTGAAIAQLFPLAALARKADGDAATAILQVTYGLAQLLGVLASGLAEPAPAGTAGAADDGTLDQVLQVLIGLRKDARANRDFATSDRIRDQLAEAGITLKDGPEGTTWERC